MSDSERAPIEVFRVLPKGTPGTFTAEEANAILEVAYLSSIADGDMSEEERDAFRDLCGALRFLVGPQAGESHVTDAELDTLLDGFDSKIDHTDVADRLAALAPVLEKGTAKEAAYKAAFGMTLCDLAEDEEEDNFDDLLLDVFGIDEKRADQWAAQVCEAIGVLEDDSDDDEDAYDDDDEGDEDDDQDGGLDV